MVTGEIKKKQTIVPNLYCLIVSSNKKNVVKLSVIDYIFHVLKSSKKETIF